MFLELQSTKDIKCILRQIGKLYADAKDLEATQKDGSNEHERLNPRELTNEIMNELDSLEFNDLAKNKANILE